ncbi:MAG TPA: M1 family metallopeptidase [Actinomycetota bacterium]|jgi:puromycin-sensitive aminopeptidase|nr:M1 family metallopeptidase [Actinomycetota bacterium]
MVADSEARYRLPRSVVPSRYDLVLEPDLLAATFSGAVDVAVRVTEPVTEVVLNALDLEIEPGWLSSNGRRVDVQKVRLDEEAQRAHLELQSPADPGEWTLHLDFRGALNDKLVGFYRSTYKDAALQSSVIATTHFEATDARRAFPCWDEPDLKAVFGVTLVVGDGLSAISNGPEVEREELGGRSRVRFADTMPMSTYLVAFVVGKLELTEPLDVDGVPTRVVHPPGKGALTPFALDVGAHSLRFYGDYYGIAYPDRKVDHVAIPDFAGGAMENLGCIIYRESALLIDPDNATIDEERDVAETVAHELAHMWFGDLVTMRWWNGIWLNEAFATFMSQLAVDAYRPDWEVWNTYARYKTHALDVDSLESTRSIEYPVHSPDDANGMFDTLTYLKGGAILRMLEQYLGADRFRDGIRRYLAKHAHGNTETHDLWDALEEETGEPVRRIMDAWIFQGGHPSITASAEDGAVRFAQRRFLQSGRADDTTWPTPMLVRQTAGGRSRTDTLLVEAEGTTLPLFAPDAVVLANAGGHSFVRVWYDDELRDRLTRVLGEELSALERYGLIDDAWAAVWAGRAPAESFLRLAQGFADETDVPTWQLILTGLGWFDRFVEGESRERLREFVRNLVRPGLERLGWEQRDGEPDLSRLLRGELLRSLAVLGRDPEAQAQARELELEASSGVHVDAHLAAAAVHIVATSGGADEYTRYREAAKARATPQEQLRYLYALAAFQDPGLMDQTLGACLTDDVRTQDAPYLLARALMNRDLGERVWRFVREHWEEENARYPESSIIGLASCVRYLTTPEAEADVAAFFAEHEIPQAKLMLQQTLERQRNAVALRERVTPELDSYFSS